MLCRRFSISRRRLKVSSRATAVARKPSFHYPCASDRPIRIWRLEAIKESKGTAGLPRTRLTRSLAIQTRMALRRAKTFDRLFAGIRCDETDWPSMPGMTMPRRRSRRIVVLHIAADLSPNQWLALTPHVPMEAHLGIGADVMSELPPAKVPIRPDDSGS
jgi:hypothetical protein